MKETEFFCRLVGRHIFEMRRQLQEIEPAQLDLKATAEIERIEQALGELEEATRR